MPFFRSPLLLPSFSLNIFYGNKKKKMMMMMNGSSCDESMMSFATLVEGSSTTTMPMPMPLPLPLDHNQHPFFFSNVNLQDSSPPPPPPPPPPPLLTTTTTTINNYPYYSPQAQEAQDYLLGSIKNEDLGLNLGRRTYFSTGDALAIDRLFANQSHYHRQHHPQLPPPRCQAEGCKADLSCAKHYHRRHKVCEFHSKAAAVVVAASSAGGLHQRFCQQCSRFHLLSEFDESKRSCRKRLADHNRRRRKPQYNNNCKDNNKQAPNFNKDTTATTTTTTTTTTSHLRSLQGLYQSQGEEVVVPFFFSNGGGAEHSSQSSNVLHLGQY